MKEATQRNPFGSPGRQIASGGAPAAGGGGQLPSAGWTNTPPDGLDPDQQMS